MAHEEEEECEAGGHGGEDLGWLHCYARRELSFAGYWLVDGMWVFGSGGTTIIMITRKY